LYLLTGEGRFTPDGYEELSGYVVSDTQRVYFFWTGWDEPSRQPTFKVWRIAEPQPDWTNSAEYAAARRAAGLD
jgi:hypothetical protein